LYQLIEANFGLSSASANGGGVPFFAYVRGFVFGVLTARLLARARRAVAPPGAMALHGVAPVAEARTDLVSGIVNTDINNQY
jgi:hypothetical protein